MTRLSVNVNDEVAAALRQLAARRGTTVTEIVRRSVAVYQFLDNAQRDGRQIRTVDNDGAVVNIEILP